MRGWIAAIAVLAATVLSPQDAQAQQTATPEPIVQATIDPPRVVVGQQATLHIVVLAPNYMTSPPELPDFQVRNAATRQLQSTNTNEQRDGVSYAGVRFEYAIYPQEPGSYAVAGQTVRVRYAVEPPATREATMPLPRLSFEAFIPDAAADLQPFVSATSLSAEQQIKRSSDQLKAGDAVTRTVTIRAEGTPAMLLPPQTFAAVAGFRLYPAQPALEDKTEGRTDVMTSTRVDSATYMLERPGDYGLPAIDIGWWNTVGGKVEQVHLDAVALTVAPNPAAGAAGAGAGLDARLAWGGLIDIVADHWLLTLAALVLLAGLAWIAPVATRRAIADVQRRRAAYLGSEAWSFRQLRKAARSRRADATYFALLGWLQRFKSTASVGSIDALTSVAGDPVLKQEINALRHELFASPQGAADWSPPRFMRHVVGARRALLRQSMRVEAAHALPQQINPAGALETRFNHRRVAR
jgi:hypothetical protein